LFWMVILSPTADDVAAPVVAMLADEDDVAMVGGAVPVAAAKAVSDRSSNFSIVDGVAVTISVVAFLSSGDCEAEARSIITKLLLMLN
jgi:hypothetical protein